MEEDPGLCAPYSWGKVIGVAFSAFMGSFSNWLEKLLEQHLLTTLILEQVSKINILLF